METNAPPGYWVNPNLEEFEYNQKKQKLPQKSWLGFKQSNKLKILLQRRANTRFNGSNPKLWEQVGVKSNPRLLTGDVTGS